MTAAWGHPAAAIDTDDLYSNVDARWELPYSDIRNAMVLDQATALTVSLFEHGWPTVMVGGNSLFDPADTAPIVAKLSPVGQVYHVTLTPALPTVIDRCATGPSRDPSRRDPSRRDPSRLAADAHLVASRPHPGSARVDNTNLTPEQTLARIARLVDAGSGRLHGPT
jgi:hypothetical protein